MRLKRRILILLTFLWMCVIFSFSAENADRSSRTSGHVVGFLEKVFFPEWNELSAEDHADRLDSFVYLIRKAAHFTEYLILGGLAAGVLLTFEKTWGIRFFISLISGVLYAVSDEIHQLAVPGRAMQLFDVLVDSTGVLFGTVCVLGIAAMVFDGKRTVQPD